MRYFYDGQIRRYLLQIMRLLSGFSYQTSNGEQKKMPVVYGTMSRQVAHILNDNSENKIPSAPKIGVYITGLEMDRDRLRDSSFVSKVNILEREIDETTNQYTVKQGKNYTVERLMPVPYKLTVNADIWATNTDQKLQIIEQILVLFNPSLEIQTNDNYVDWTSLTIVELDSINYSSRSVPQGVDSEIDITTLTFSTPILISPPAKVKKLGIITDIITNVFAESKSSIDLEQAVPQLQQYNDVPQPGIVDAFTREIGVGGLNEPSDSSDNLNQVTLSLNYKEIYTIINGNEVIAKSRNSSENVDWRHVLELYPGTYKENVSRIFFTNLEFDIAVNGTIKLDSTDSQKLIINWDSETFPSDTVLPGPARPNDSQTTIDYIVDPRTFNPTGEKTPGLRLLIINDIGSSLNENGPSAWKNNDNSDFIAYENDIIEWDGQKWNIIFNSKTNNDVVYITNLKTNSQYRWYQKEWLKSVDGIYPPGAWRIILDY